MRYNWDAPMVELAGLAGFGPGLLLHCTLFWLGTSGPKSMPDCVLDELICILVCSAARTQPVTDRPMS